MKCKVLLLFVIFALGPTLVRSQSQLADTTYRKFYVGSSFFMLGNLIPDDPNPPGFIQLNFGYWMTSKDVISVELKTWKYAWPLGIPYGDSFEAPEEKYPGYIRTYGIAFVYQRFFYKGLYGGIHVMNALQKFVDEDNVKIQNGYQLFLTYRLGYQIILFKKRGFKNQFFIEPSIAINHWPINTNVPEDFAAVDKKWPNYFLFEPGLHFGMRF